jgi:preprotein translocase subunit YajC
MAAGSQNQFIVTMVWLVVLMGMMYFMMIRPQQQQQKKRDQMMTALKSGDRIVTTSGIVGVVTQVRDESLSVKIADRVEIELMKSGVAYIKTN